MNLEKIISNKNKEAVIKNDCKQKIEAEKKRQNIDNAKTNRELIKPLLDLLDKHNVSYKGRIHKNNVVFRMTYIKLINREPNTYHHNGDADVNMDISVNCKKDKPFACQIYNFCYNKLDGDLKFSNLTEMVEYIAETVTQKKMNCKNSVYYRGLDKIFADV